MKRKSLLLSLMLALLSGSAWAQNYTLTLNTIGGSYGSVTGNGSYAPNTTVTPKASAAENGYFIKWSDGETSLNHPAITMTQDVTLTAIFVPKVIANATDWNNFADAVTGTGEYADYYYDYSTDGKKDVTMTNDVGPIETMVGKNTSDNKYRFKGIFDGNGKTLIFNKTITSTAEADQYTAPFRFIDGATIKDLKLAGTVTTNNKFAGGVVAHARNYNNLITNCVNSTIINASKVGSNSAASHGGILGQLGGTGSVTISGSAFNGEMHGTEVNYWCGILGYISKKESTVLIKDCLFNPTVVDVLNSTENYSITREWTGYGITASNNYYNKEGAEMHVHKHGTQAYALTLVANPTEGGTVTHSGTAGQTYDVSTITTYGTGNGLDCGGTFYAPAGNYELTATPNTNYAFVDWSDGSTTIQDNPYTFNVSDNRTLTANFVFTFTKTIEAYDSESGRGGYYLIASPLVDAVSPATVGMITDNLGNTATTATGTYDLYSFDQAQELEWQNYRASTFDLVNGQGYLYATSKEGTTLTFSGTPYSGNGIVTLSKTGDVRFSGWNLVGNPFPVRAYPSKTSFYIMNDDGDGIIAVADADPSRNYVEPMEGIFVIANEHGETMTFSTQNPGKKGQIVNVNVTKACSRDAAVIDRAIVRFDEGEGLEKFQLNPKHTKIYIPQNGTDYAVVHADGAGTIPVNFKAEDNGTYTLDFTTEEVSFGYLHLIDNMNGNDVDLLQTPYYTFDAKSTDFASRFTLVFATGSSAGSETDNFAFFNNGVWIINNPSTGSGAEATLQVVDVMGRVLSSETISGSCSKAINVATGVYMLRLINGNDVKVQKIVVRR